MDKVLIKLYKDEELEELSSKLLEISLDSLGSFVDDHVLRQKHSGKEPTTILRAIFKGCNHNKNHLSSHSLAIFLHCLKLLVSPDVSQNIGTDIIGIMLLEIDNLSTGGLVDSSKMITEMIKNGNTGHGRALQVLPKLLMCLSQKPEVHLGSGQGVMPGVEYKKHVINSLCSGKWSSESIIHLANVFKDVPMAPEELGFFLRKMLRQLERLDVQEIPPLVHQMLPLGGRTHHETILRGVFTVCERLESRAVETKKKTTDEVDAWNEMFEIEEDDGDKSKDVLDVRDLRTAEGTVLLHLTNMARWDQSLGKAFIKMLKLAKEALSESTLSTFFLAFALSLSQIKRFQEEVLTQLKTVVFRSFLNDHRQVKSNWLRQRGLASPDIGKALIGVMEACKHGWDQVVTGIVLLAFSLLDTYGPKPGAFGRVVEGDPVKTDSPQQKSSDLGASLLATAFKNHPVVRTEIIEQILNRCITRASAPINHYIDILKGIAKRYPSTLLETKRKLMEFFECLCLLSPQNADCVLRAILPLIRINSHLKDSLILVLRKSLFSCQLNGRIIACNGFLLLLQTFKVSGYVSLSQASSQCSQSIFSISSQIQVDVHSSAAGPSSSQGTNHEPLCLEVLSTLRRCLTQQAPIRATLYKGLWNVISHNPQLAGPSFEKLLVHFRRYYEDHEGVIPPLKMESCVAIQNGEPTLLEPLPLLLSSMFVCLKKIQDLQKSGENLDCDDEDDILDENLVKDINEILQSLTTRMIKSEMEDFELDKSADFSNNTSVGKKNCILGNLVMTTYETLMENTFLREDFTEEDANRLLGLFQPFKKMRGVICSGRKDAGKSSSSISLLSGISSPLYVKNLINGLFCDESPDREASLGILRADDDFVKYAIELAARTVNHAKDHGFMKGIGGFNKDLVQDTCMAVGRACLHKFMQEKNNSSNSSIAHACLDAFHSSLQYVILRKKKRLEEFLTSSLQAGGASQIPSSGLDVLAKHIRRFQRIVISYLSEDVTLSSAHSKILLVLISILDTLSSTSCAKMAEIQDDLPQHSSTPCPAGITQMHEWVGKLCSEQVIDDGSATKSLINLHLRLSTAYGPWTGTDKAAQGSEGAVQDIAKDIHLVAGDAEPEEEESRIEDERKRGSHYSIIDECNVVQLVPLCINHVESAVEETDWLLQRVKGQVAALVAEDKLQDSIEQNDNDSEFHEKRRKIESAMCVRLGILLTAYREFLLSALPLGPPLETSMRGLTKLFTLLTNFTKYYIWLVGQGVTKTPSPKFEKLVKLCGSEVTRNVYPFINYIESAQSNRLSNAGRKRKRKEGEARDSAPTASEKTRVLRETRNIPPLIYAIENMERFLISLGRKCKMDFLSGHKLPTSRDFRIKSAVIKEALAQHEEKGSEDEGQESASDNEGGNSGNDETKNGGNTSKRARVE